MSLLTVVQNVMDSNGWPAPTVGVVGVSDQNMRQAFALVNKILIGISNKKNWPMLTKDYTFDTVAGQSQYTLPTDFHHIIAGSAWNADQYYQMQGSMPSSLWYRRMYNGTGSVFQSAYRISADIAGTYFTVYPEPQAAETLAFMYVSNMLVVSSAQTLKQLYTADDDTAIIDEWLVELGLTWRWREKKGMDFTAELAEFNSTLKDRYAQYLAAGDIRIGGFGYDYWDQWPLTNGYIGQGPIGG